MFAAAEIFVMVGFPIALTTAEPLSLFATPASHSALNFGSKVATYSACAESCWRVPSIWRPTPATALSQDWACRQAFWADEPSTSVATSAAANSADTPANAVYSLRLTDRFR